MKSEVVQSGDGQCQNCKQRNTLIELSCKHFFCVKCLTFSYHKHKLVLNRVSQTQCICCRKIVELEDSELRMINEFTDQVLVPLMRQEEEGKNVKTQPNQASAPSKQFKSYEQSIEKSAPISRGMYSKCESPKTNFNQANCPVHPDQQLSVVCLTCQNSFLCISCTAGKKHASHSLKSLSQGWEAVQEQLNLCKLKVRQNIGVLDMYKKRGEVKKGILHQRWDKAKQSLELHFDNLIELINRKRKEIVLSCSDLFNKEVEGMMRDENRIEEALKCSRRQMERLKQAGKTSGGPLEAIKKSTQLIEQIKYFNQQELESNEIRGNYEWEGVVRDLARVCQQMQKVTPHSTLQFNSTTIKASRSEEKLMKDLTGKRTKTNMISLNSSRQRRQKKYTKTEQDERRNKTKANYKTESASKLTKVNKAYPAYLVQCLEKNNIDSFAQNNPMTSSFKSTKLLSKSHLPTEDVKKKIKQRVERKTFNGGTKQHKHVGDGMRKKKIPC